MRMMTTAFGKLLNQTGNANLIGKSNLGKCGSKVSNDYDQIRSSVDNVFYCPVNK